MTRESELEQNVFALRERLYAVHKLNLPEVTAALQGHLDVMDINVYQHRTRLEEALASDRSDLQQAKTLVLSLTTERNEFEAQAQRYHALALRLWKELGHNPETEPLPMEEP